jgi:zinc and cadmium transporter
MNELTRFALVCFGVFVLTLLGGLLPLVRDWDKKSVRTLLAFGTGVLLGAVFFHMLPEATIQLGGRAGGAVLGGFLLIYVLERFVMVHACEEEGCDFHRMGLAAFAGITIHALIDGVALGAGFSLASLSTAVTLAIVLHKLPDSLSLSGILLHCEYPKGRILKMVAFFAIATPLGAILSYAVLREVEGVALAYAVAFSAGTFLAIATADLLPQVHSAPDGRVRNLLALFAGIFVMTLGLVGPGVEDALHGAAHSPHGEASP